MVTRVRRALFPTRACVSLLVLELQGASLSTKKTGLRCIHYGAYLPFWFLVPFLHYRSANCSCRWPTARQSDSLSPPRGRYLEFGREVAPVMFGAVWLRIHHVRITRTGNSFLLRPRHICTVYPNKRAVDSGVLCSARSCLDSFSFYSCHRQFSFSSSSPSTGIKT